MNGGVLWGRPRPGKGCSTIGGCMVCRSCNVVYSQPSTNSCDANSTDDRSVCMSNVLYCQISTSCCNTCAVSSTAVFVPTSHVAQVLSGWLWDRSICSYCDWYHFFLYIPLTLSLTRGSAVGWGTALQAGRSRVRFLMVSLEFFIDIILPAALWPRG